VVGPETLINFDWNPIHPKAKGKTTMDTVKMAQHKSWSRR